MDSNQTMVAQGGSKQINTTGSVVNIDFFGFSVGESTIVEELHRDGVNVISEVTDDASLELLQGEIFRGLNGKPFTGIKIQSGAVVIYREA